MSRSRKKTPYSGDRKDRRYKRYANKKVRQKLKNSEEIYNYKEYKKLFCSYDICDYYTIEGDFETFYKNEISRWYRWRVYPYLNYEFPTREKAYQDYMRYYIRK